MNGDEWARLFAKLKEAEDLLHLPDARGHLERAERALTAISRPEVDAGIRNRVTHALTAIDALSRSASPRGNDIDLNKALWRLRLALEETRAAENEDVR